jgi:transposase
VNARPDPANYFAAVAADVALRYGAAVPDASVVQVLPAGATSAAYPVWCPKLKQLRYPDGAAFYRRTMSNTLSGGKKPVGMVGGSKPSEASLARRDLVLDLHASGKSDREITAQLQISQHTLKHDRKMLNLFANRDKTAANARLERDKKICALRSKGWSHEALAKEFSLSQHVIRRLVAKVVLSPAVAAAEKADKAKRVRKPAQYSLNDILERRVALAEFLSQLGRECTRSDIMSYAEAKGIAQNTVQRDMAKLGHAWPPMDNAGRLLWRQKCLATLRAKDRKGAAV